MENNISFFWLYMLWGFLMEGGGQKVGFRLAFNFANLILSALESIKEN